MGQITAVVYHMKYVLFDGAKQLNCVFYDRANKINCVLHNRASQHRQ